MKNLKISLLFSFIALLVFALPYCKLDDQVLGGDITVNSATTLVSQKVTTAPAIDGSIETLWDNVPKLVFEATVPDPGGDLFRGYSGNVMPSIVLRSVYDDKNIYFLAEWPDQTESITRRPWYFDPATKKWAQESGEPTFSATGTITRPAFMEDKVAMLWNIDNSVSGWNSGTCYKSCHTGMSEADGFARHRTNNANERIDMWHWKSVRNGINTDQFDDQYQDNGYPNGRKNDAGTGGTFNNSQSLAITGSGSTTKVSVPKYLIPNRVNYNWFLESEITDGTAKLITAVDTAGVLTLADGVTIDPKADVEYQRAGASVGTKAIPGAYSAPYVGSRGDITCKAIHTGSGWVFEYTRALKTADTEKKDIDFSSLADQNFGFAIFENADVAHAIKPNLLLKFQK